MEQPRFTRTVPPRYRRIDSPSNIYYYTGFWVVAGILFAAFLGAWGVILGYIVNEKASSSSDTEATTDFFSPTTSISSSIATGENTMMIPCLNFSLGSETKTFSGKTFLGQVCPTPLNPCLESVCGSDGLCHEQLVVEDGCYHDSMCNNVTTNGTKCDLNTCMCISPIALGIVAVDYTPTLNFTDPALDLENPQSLTANYVDYGNYVEVRIQYSAFANGTTNSDFSFDFTLPSGLDADAGGSAVGNHIVHTTPGLITSASNTTLAAQGTVSIVDFETATATGANSNPLFTGPSETADLYTGSIFLQYFKD